MQFAAPDPASALIHEALQRRNVGDNAAALSLLERAVEEAESANARVRAYIELGKVLDTLGKRQSAQSCFRRVMSLTDDWRFRDEARKLFRKRIK
jgi:tetratricopeptide (TPR) repeat protein